jgi:hypothetical protein
MACHLRETCRVSFLDTPVINNGMALNLKTLHPWHCTLSVVMGFSIYILCSIFMMILLLLYRHILSCTCYFILDIGVIFLFRKEYQEQVSFHYQQ